MEFDSREVDAPLRALLVAVDGGPRASLAPLAAHVGSAPADVDSPDAQHAAHWSRELTLAQCELLVVGTSDSARARCIESAARRAARSARIPIAAIEDFPGNYCDVEGGEATLLVVESNAAADIARARLGARTPPLAVVAPARYDRYRTQVSDLRRRTSEAWARQQRPAALWAGQPETGDCLETLYHVLPALRARGAELLFKAHPRDAGHVAGRYCGVLEKSRVDFRDITALDVESALALAPRLVVTQFSSVALEAGFYGIPGVWVLLPGAGGDRLEQKKGYRIPAPCAAGGAGLAREASEVDALIGRGLEDSVFRANLMQRFDDYCRVHERGTRALAETLRSLRQM